MSVAVFLRKGQHTLDAHQKWPRITLGYKLVRREGTGVSPQVEFAEQAQYYYFNGMFIWGEEGAEGDYKGQSPSALSLVSFQLQVMTL